jgi:hypothetical protein
MRLGSAADSNGTLHNPDYDTQDQHSNRSGSEDKETLTPAQSRRKAQNRAA